MKAVCFLFLVMAWPDRCTFSKHPILILLTTPCAQFLPKSCFAFYGALVSGHKRYLLQLAVDRI